MRGNRCWFFALAGWALVGCSMTPSEPKRRVDSGWLIEAQSYYASAHGDMECTECHEGMILVDDVFPHGEENLAEDRKFDEQVCERCHQTAFRQAGIGVHARAAEKQEEARRQGLDPAGLFSFGVLAPRCFDCHPIHRLPRKENNLP